MDREPKRLYRSAGNRVLAGVCGGLGEYFNLDPTVVRVLFAFFAFAGGVGIVAYVALWIIIPDAGKSPANLGQQTEAAVQEMKSEAENVLSGNQSSPGSAALFIGSILVLVGIFALGNQVLPWRIFRWEMFWPFALVAVGVAIMIRKR